jgi:signal transduction histidine kinase/CheY-like chemotaxis protein
VLGQRRELEGLRQDGTRFPMRLAVSEMLWNGRRTFTGIITDLSLQRRTEEELRRAQAAALEANRLTAMFLANVSHAFRTPLSGIFGMADLATEASDPAELQEFVHTIRAEAESLLSVLSDIMDFSKLEAGELLVESVPFRLRQSLLEALQPLAARAHHKGLELVCDVAPDVPDELQGDLSRLLQSTSKVVENAIKFTERGEVVVRARRTTQGADGIVLDLSVTDTGPGIPPEKQQSIFTPFAHAAEPRTTQTDGTGLGLAITSKLLQALHGDMRLESVVGQGTTFHLSVPLAVDHAAVSATPERTLQGRRVLVADDNASSRDAALGMLGAWEADVTAAHDGPSAVDAIRRAHAEGRPFALAIVDADMDGMDGFTLTARLRNDPELARTPVLLATASGQTMDQQRAHAAGALGCLRKPLVATRELLAAVEQALRAAHDPDRRDTALGRAARTPLEILLVEDNDVGRLVTSRIIEKAGHRVVTAINGREAISAAERQRFDVILMDVQMPEVDGFQATAAIRERERSTGDHVPIVALTAYAMSGERELSLGAGMDAYVTKPVRSAELFATIERLQREIARPQIPAMCEWQPPQVIDPESLRRQTGGDPAALFNTASRLLEESRRLLHAIRAGLDSGDRVGVEHGARRLKGSLRTLTASAARAAALRLEAVARAGDLSQASHLMSRLEHEVDRLEPAISSLESDRSAV